mmetsp:Transcript_60954/g.125604  ORF Transcript_60954/g.125604 Transcript_60954/m.125604 type:complete len:462 (+) Transcript_60954:169-1554(+)
MALKASTILLLCSAVSLCCAESELKSMWKHITENVVEYGEWGLGVEHERRGQICDPWREYGASEIGTDLGLGCTVVFISDPDDEFTVGTVAAGEQNGFQNTQHYNAAWNLHGEGFLGDSLPRSPQDIHPVCYIANVSGTIVLGYEEGNGDVLMPCPGADTAVPFTEEMILNADEEELQDMCSQCYQAVCTGERSTIARSCGSTRDGGVQLEDTADFQEQVGPAYHCHLTMADHGACDYVQYVQHESSRTYYMDYSVLCGWDNIKHLNITHCDCTKEAGTANNCRREEATNMALAGVVCGNCNGVGFSQDRAFDSIFKPTNEDDRFDGTCAGYITQDTEIARDYSMMMCSKGLWCPNEFNGGDSCKFHCERFGKFSEIYYDTDCGDYVVDDEARRRHLLSIEDADALLVDEEHVEQPEKASESKGTITAQTRFDRGHAISSVFATGYDRRKGPAGSKEQYAQ